MRCCLLSVAIAFSFAAFADADFITIDGDVSAGTASLTINNDINFNITGNGPVSAVIFDEWTTSDGTFTAPLIEGGASVVAITIRGMDMTRSGNLIDNFTGSVGVVTPNDGYIVFDSSAGVFVGDIFTLEAGTYALDAASGFNPLLNDSTFSGPVFLTDVSGNRLSEDGIAVPEPSFAIIGLIGLVGLISRRPR